MFIGRSVSTTRISQFRRWIIFVSGYTKWCLEGRPALLISTFVDALRGKQVQNTKSSLLSRAHWSVLSAFCLVSVIGTRLLSCSGPPSGRRRPGQRCCGRTFPQTWKMATADAHINYVCPAVRIFFYMRATTTLGPPWLSQHLLLQASTDPPGFDLGVPIFREGRHGGRKGQVLATTSHRTSFVSDIWCNREGPSREESTRRDISHVAGVNERWDWS